ncbi:maleylpyruvate isomerase family mycothiol-dependent enzyme [Nocardioides sp. Soil777]|uniref:maleylpyruvate isomerase family mycothiol-dependent enzyme n=1 Tax=Nocardioides sp. Soil777 TaxID=1736409 RepID=UPI0009EA30D1|nr:maleylpyruvate isomerase family mycothiol-dependent enzyme [Nocardioides sp. Soil777]
MTWVAKERRSFAASFRDADPDAPTLCDGWTTRHLLAHVVQREHAILRNIWDQVTTKSPGEERFMRSLVTKAGSPHGYAVLVDTLEAGPSRHSLMGRFDETLNLLEYVVHHEDLRRGSGPVPHRTLHEEEVRELWRRARPILTRAYRKAPVAVRLEPDDSALTAIGNHSSGVVLSGAPLELVLHAFGRRQAADIGIQGSADATRSFAEWSAQK